MYRHDALFGGGDDNISRVRGGDIVKGKWGSFCQGDLMKALKCY